MDRRDPYHRRAKQQGYRSRAAFKLLELDARERLLRPGGRVLDLGAAPGGWMQVALERVGPAGRVVGIDLARIEPLPAANAAALRGDLRDPATAEALRAALGGAADVVLSDLSPKLTGVRATDIARSLELVETAARLAAEVLRPGGAFVAKLFAAPETDALLARLRGGFAALRIVDPEASRKASSEFYVVAKGFRGRAGGNAPGGAGPGL
jgi:23S rRNA (uridine2552-2'-O)-methyltransferase